jgi:O-antigen/teichoic acid export membrane protein
MQGEPARARATFLDGTRWISYASLSVFPGLALTAPDWARCFLGEHWVPAVPMVQAVALSAGVAVSRMLVAPFLYAVGRPYLALIPAAIGLAITIVGAVATAGLGELSAAIAWAARVLIILPVGAMVLSVACAVPFARQMGASVPALAAAVAMTAAAAIPLSLMETGWGRLASTVAVGTIAYVGALLIVDARARPGLARIAESLFSSTRLSWVRRGGRAGSSRLRAATAPPRSSAAPPTA